MGGTSSSRLPITSRDLLHVIEPDVNGTSPRNLPPSHEPTRHSQTATFARASSISVIDPRPRLKLGPRHVHQLDVSPRQRLGFALLPHRNTNWDL